MVCPCGSVNPIALRKAKIAHNFGLSECNKVEEGGWRKGQDGSLVCTVNALSNGTHRNSEKLYKSFENESCV